LIGDIVNIISPELETETAVIEVTFKSSTTFLIHHPDLMLTMTSIANAMPCTRKPILQQMVKASGPATKPILYGNIQHTLLQSALTDRAFSADDTRRRLDEELKKESTKLDIWGAGMGIEDVRAEIGQKAEVGFQAFGDKWVGSLPKVSFLPLLAWFNNS
jgi:DNA replication ATP-dependent helicase Dna2